ncbi:hypothetical protein AMTR_s00108p00104480 [Amborella trichopoda]|uniref:Uncharacterized protein n=1 Tax=Amborella trichopoda TaxID=13333 RepID=W1NQW2_AMBTC|nr:hypothetical protein AMTR_s00108p00104480 [Amborella trichopoda]
MPQSSFPPFYDQYSHLIPPPNHCGLHPHSRKPPPPLALHSLHPSHPPTPSIPTPSPPPHLPYPSTRLPAPFSISVGGPYSIHIVRAMNLSLVGQFFPLKDDTKAMEVWGKDIWAIFDLFC